MELKKHLFYKLASDVKEICKPLLENYGISYFNYSRVYPNNKALILTTLPEWIEYFINNSYQNISVIETKNIKSKIEQYKIWDAHAAMYPNTKSLLIQEEARKKFQLHHGLTLCKDNSTFSERFSFATHEHNYRINEYYERFQDIFQKFTLYFKACTNDVIKSLDKNLIDYPIRLIPQEDMRSKLAINQTIEIEKFYIETLKGSIYLTLRELDCISWALQGKTIEETAIILNLSTATVKTHIFHVKQKLGVSKMIDIFRILKEQDLLDIYSK